MGEVVRRRIIMLCAVAAAVVVGLVAGAAASFAQSATPAASPTVAATATTESGPALTAKVGESEAGYSVNAFLPQNLTVRTGTTVTWQFDWYEPHMIVLDNGLTNADLTGPEPAVDESPFDFNGYRKYVYSGLIIGDPDDPPTFAIKFEKSGTYKILCLIHPGMTGTVTVADDGGVDTQSAADGRATQEYANLIAPLKAAATAAAKKPQKVTTQPDGSKVHEVDMLPAVAGPNGTNNFVQQYVPETATIAVGDSVKWVNDTPDNIHTVTFSWQNGGFDPNTTDLTTLPPVTPTANTFDGSTEYINSGILASTPEDHSHASFTLKFTKIGTYAYVCLLHLPEGMTGRVNVEAKAASPSPSPGSAAAASPTSTARAASAPPKAGSGAGNSHGIAPWLFFVGAIVVVVGGGAVWFALRRK